MVQVMPIVQKSKAWHIIIDLDHNIIHFFPNMDPLVVCTVTFIINRLGI